MTPAATIARHDRERAPLGGSRGLVVGHGVAFLLGMLAWGVGSRAVSAVFPLDSYVAIVEVNNTTAAPVGLLIYDAANFRTWSAKVAPGQRRELAVGLGDGRDSVDPPTRVMVLKANGDVAFERALRVKELLQARHLEVCDVPGGIEVRGAGTSIGGGS